MAPGRVSAPRSSSPALSTTSSASTSRSSVQSSSSRQIAVNVPERSKMAPGRVSASSRSSSPAVSTISSASTSRSSVSSSSSSSRPIAVTVPERSKMYLVLITGLSPPTNTKQAVHSVIQRFLPKLPITQLIAIPEGILVQSPVPVKQQLLNTIGAAQFGPGASITSKIPASSTLTMASVVIRGVDVQLSDSQVRDELLKQRLQVQRVMRIKNDKGPTFMVRAWSGDQETLQSLLDWGAVILKKRHRVEPSYELVAAVAST